MASIYPANFLHPLREFVIFPAELCVCHRVSPHPIARLRVRRCWETRHRLVVKVSMKALPGPGTRPTGLVSTPRKK